MRQFLGMARDVMNRTVATLDSNEDVRTAAKKMIDENIGSIIVVQDDRLVGILTKSDYVRAFANEKEKTKKVGDLMSKPVITCEPETQITDLIDIMRLNGIRHIPVVKKNKVVGIVTDFDLACLASSNISRILLALRPPKD